jgi:hypothetical protein
MMNTAVNNDMIAEKGILTMILSMVIGQVLMISGSIIESMPGNILLLSIVEVDQYLVALVHLLSALSFALTIIVGAPKAWKQLKGIKRTRKKRKLS